MKNKNCFPTILTVIPARGGSKGLKNKNILSLAGKPLIAYTIEAAHQSRWGQNAIVSTDSKNIAAIARRCGAQVPFIRPRSLATDKASTLGVLQHAVKEWEKKAEKKVDHVLLLQCTAPLRTAKHIDQAVWLFLSRKQDSLISCYEGASVHPSIMYTEKRGQLIPFCAQGKLKRRQDFKAVYVRNGAIYLMSRALLMEKNQIVGEQPLLYLMSRVSSINIDTQEDFDMAELILTHKKGRN
ncbi:MAG: acylneuraminate cytidylyltransferase family protein [Candidatus Omnitrophica bacterium]|nr:acylneuraminate cytidylyltransferase family protein [Candidatus Omnitrophota bacterium]